MISRLIADMNIGHNLLLSTMSGPGNMDTHQSSDADVAALRTQLRQIIGQNHVYVSAKDPQRHFEPITLAAGYAVWLFTLYITEIVKQLGEKTATAAVDEVAARLKGTSHAPSPDAKRQLDDLRTADAALQSLSARVGDQYLAEFVNAGKHAIERQLRADNFPPEKANRIAVDFARSVERRMRDDERA